MIYVMLSFPIFLKVIVKLWCLCSGCIFGKNGKW